MNGKLIVLFFGILAATSTFAQDVSTPASDPSSTAGSLTDRSSGSANATDTSASSAPPVGSQNQNSTVARGTPSDQASSNNTNIGQDASTSTAGAGEGATTASSVQSTSQAPVESTSDVSTTTAVSAGNQQSQGRPSQVGAQGRASDNADSTQSKQRSATPRRNATVNNANTGYPTSLNGNVNANVVSAGNFGPIQTNAQWSPITEMNVQSPRVGEALTQLAGRGRVEPLNSAQMYDLIATAQAGSDYPNYSDIPPTGFSCENVNQAGFYADTEARCQVIRRCDINAIQYSYLCPNMTVFNQITLICDWFFNVDCNQSKNFYDYSNRRLYHGSDWVLLSDDINQGPAVNVATTRDPLLEI